MAFVDQSHEQNHNTFLLIAISSFLLPSHHLSDNTYLKRTHLWQAHQQRLQNPLEKFAAQQHQTTRLFDDEQLGVEENESWPGVEDNPFVLPLVQLPKNFSMSN